MLQRLMPSSARILASVARVAAPSLGATSAVSRLLVRFHGVDHKCNIRDDEMVNKKVPQVPKKEPFKIIKRVQHSAKVVELVVKAPHVAQYCKAGQFTVVRVDDRSERIPLTIADFDREAGTITLVIQNVGYSSSKICSMLENAEFKDFLGPLGTPSEIENFGKVVCIGGGLGIAPVYPIQRALKDAGNTVYSIMGAKTKDMLFWKDEMGKCADSLTVCTDDGTDGRKGFVTDALRELLEKDKEIKRVIAIGPAIMMYRIAELTQKYNVPTVVSLNTIMVDGTGMCGGCRVKVGKETKFVCVDGPEFDAHKVDWGLMLSRMDTYKDMEKAVGLYDKKDPEASARVGAFRIPMPCQDPEYRATNFEEVALGYSADMAIAEANRCLQCGNSPCRNGCPVNVDIKRFIAEVQEGRFVEACSIIKESHDFPAISGRVCPQEVQCESKCKMLEEGQPIAIGRLERFCADYAAAHPDQKPKNPKKPAAPKKGKKAVAASVDLNTYRSKIAGKKVAVVGAGPAGLVTASTLAKLGVKVSVFEALSAPGGVLIYGIPEFRLPKEVVRREADAVEKMGVEFRFNYPVGNAGSVPELLKQGYDAVFIGTGAGLPYFLGVPGDDLAGVYSSNEFLTRVNLMKAYKYPDYQTPILKATSVAVFGGGNVAMDSARCAKRLGAKNVYICYRRTKNEMPARIEELHHAIEEGVIVKELVSPVKIVGDAKGHVTGVELQPMELSAPDDKGRRNAIKSKKPAEILPVEQIIVSIGQGPNPLIMKHWPELKLRKSGNIVVDKNQMTNIPGVFAGGDIVTGAATVILAMGAGRKASEGIVKYLAGEIKPESA